MIAAHDPLIGPLAARQSRDNVIDRLQVPVEFQLEMRRGRARAKMVGDGQSAAPILRRDWARHRAQQRQRVGV
jgi:hypothetical protein